MIVICLYSILLKFFLFVIFLSEMYRLNCLNLCYVGISIFDLTLLLGVAKLFRNRNFAFISIFVVNLATGVLINGTFMYFRMFGIPLSFNLLLFARNLQNLGDIGPSIIALFQRFDAFLYIIDAGILMALLSGKLRERFRKTDEFFLKISFKKLFSVGLICLIVWGFYSEPRSSLWELFERTDSEGLLTFNPVGYYFVESFREIKAMIFPPRPTPEILSRLSKGMASLKRKREESAGPVPWITGSRIPKPNIIIIQVESLMSGFLNVQYKGVPVLPNISRMASSSVFLSNFFSQVIATSDSDFSTLTSLLPLENKNPHLNFFENDFQSLPKVLKKKGYQCIYGNGVPKDFWNVSEMNTRLGFDKQSYLEDLPSEPRIGPWFPDEFLLSGFACDLASSPRPFFAMYLTSSSHHPFNLSNLPVTFSDEGLTGPEKQRVQYMNAIHYTDGAIGNFLEKLKKTGIIKDTVIVLYGDHPMFLDFREEELRSRYGNLPLSEKVIRLFNSTIPCLFYAPEFLKPQVLNRYCGQVDIGPTLLEICGIPVPDLFLGRSVFSRGQGFVLHKFQIGLDDSRLFYGKHWDSEKYIFCFSLPDLKPATPTETVAEAFTQAQVSEWLIRYNVSPQ